MSRQQEKTPKLIFTRKKQTFILVLVATVAVVGLIFLLQRRTDKIVYEERQQLLSMVTNSASQTFNRSIQAEWDVYNLAYSIVARCIHEAADIRECITNANIQHDFGSDYYFLVDEDGMYYSSDGIIGKLNDFEYFKKTSAERVEYLFTLPHLNPKKTFLIYRGRFDQPIKITTETGTKYLVYFAYAQDLDNLKNAIGSMYQGSSNIVIYDARGSILYEDYGMPMVADGYNVFKKLEQCSMPFGESAEDVVQKCKRKENVVIEIRNKGNNYYYCSSSLNISDWSLALVLLPQEINKTIAEGVWIIMIYLLIIVAIIGATLILISRSVRHRAQEQRLNESRQFAEAMAETSRAKTVFLSNMSHDIRTPINGIIGVTTIARNSTDNPKKIVECLDKIDTASNHLLSLINDVLDMSRIESGKTRIATEPADIRDICEGCCSIIRDQLADRSLKFTSEMEIEHSKIFADAVHLRRIFINILSNAVKFTRDGGRILFRCKETEFDVNRVTYKFEIKDTGIGMSKQFLNRIFDSFAQEENRERSNYKGTGLGMAITKQLVDLMGGTIRVESEINKGSSFYVTLTFDRDFEERGEEKAKVTETNIENIRILLVEDNELNMEIAETLLTHNGAVVDKAWDGLEAIDKFTAKDIGSYDVILMDIMMPRMDGLEAAKAIRALNREDAQEIPIIAMTANAFEDDIRASKEAGMNAHLSKPIEIDEVIRTISSFVHKQ